MRSTFLRPSVMIPLVGGAVAGLISLSVGGSIVLTSLAVAGMGGGAVWAIARTVLNIESLTEQAMATEQQSLREAENRELDLLARHLRTDKDHRTQDALKLLRSLRDEFESAAQRPGGEVLSARISEQISQIFHVAVGQLRETCHLTQRAESVVGEAREKILSQRSTLINEIQTTLDRLQSVVQQYKTLRPESQEQEMSALEDELRQNLEIARRTELRMKELENPLQAHESFLKE